MFSGHVETLILKFSPANATKVRLPGRGRKGRGEGMGYFDLGAPTKICCYGPADIPLNSACQNFKIAFFLVLEKHVNVPEMFWNCS